MSSSDIGNVAVGQTVTLTVTTSSAASAASAAAASAVASVGVRRRSRRGRNGRNRQRRVARGAPVHGPTATGTVTEVAKVADRELRCRDSIPVTVDVHRRRERLLRRRDGDRRDRDRTRASNVLQVPVRAVDVDNGASTVTVATNGKLSGPTETRTVKTGATANGMVEITDGVREGEQVVVIVRQFSATGNGSNPSGGTFPGGGNFSGRGRFPGGGGGNVSGVANGSTP